MRTTVNLDDELLAKAAELTGTVEKSQPVRLGLQALIAQQNARRLATLGGSGPAATASPGRRES